jgi:hypothetical protein
MAVFEKKEENILGAKKLRELIQYLEGFHFVYNAMLARRSNVLDSRYASFSRHLRVCKTKEECNNFKSWRETNSRGEVKYANTRDTQK